MSRTLVTGTDLLSIARMHSEVWAIENGYAQGALAYLSETEYAEHKAAYDARMAAPMPTPNRVRPDDRMYAIENGVAMIPIQGVMTMKPTSFGGCSTILTRRAIRMAAVDQDVKSIVLLVNSPGGTVEGTEELALVVGEAAAAKNVTSYIQGGCHSAAYWVSSYATKIVSHRLALCGSIGAMNSVLDSSEQAAMDGVKVILVASRPLKGQGTPGVPVSPEAVKMLEGHVQYFGDAFDAIILANRGLTKAQATEAFTGGTFTAPDALRLGLIDAIQPLDELLAEIQESTVTLDDTDPDDLDEELRAGGEGITARGGLEIVGKFPFRSARTATPPEPTTTSTPRGGETRPRAGEREPSAPETIPMSNQANWKNALADACRARGLGDIASALDTSTREDADNIARIVADNIQTQVSSHLANDPLARAVKANGIHTQADMATYAATHAIGAKHFEDLKDKTQKQAIRAYGADLGPKMCAGIGHLGYEAVAELHDQFKTHADTTFGTGDEKKPERKSAPGGPTPTAKDATETSARAFDKLDADMQAKVKAAAPDDAAKQDKLAAEFLGMVGV